MTVEKAEMEYDLSDDHRRENNIYKIKVHYRLTFTDYMDNPKNSIEYSFLFSISELKNGINGEAKIIDIEKL